MSKTKLSEKLMDRKTNKLQWKKRKYKNENHQLENAVYPASQKRTILYFGEKAARNQLLPPKIFLNNYVHLSAYDVIYHDNSYRKRSYRRNIKIEMKTNNPQWKKKGILASRTKTINSKTKYSASQKRRVLYSGEKAAYNQLLLVNFNFKRDPTPFGNLPGTLPTEGNL